MDSLIVYLNDRPVGRLTDDNGRLAFAYSAEYASDAVNEPLSYSLPLRGEPFDHGEIEPFLSGLLPDDIIRTRIARLLQIPRENTFALLKAIGGDCAGAVAFFPDGENPHAPDSPRYRPLEDGEAGQILDNLEHRPLDVGEDGFRISGAGAQDKLIACWHDGRISLPLDGMPSTHIIKTSIRDYPDSVENETFAMTLAAACGLDCAKCSMEIIGGKRRYVCERYDRAVSGGRVVRLHQEDFCQLLRIDPKRKYEALGGPGIVSSFKLLRELSLPATATLELLRRIIFNFLVGNGDAHGKNFSILYHGGKSALAPMYDVMSTAIYPEVSKRMAMKIDGEYSFKLITRGKFMRMADRLAFSRKTMEKELDRMTSRILSKAPKLAEKLNARFPCSCYNRICEGIVGRTVQLSGPVLSPPPARTGKSVLPR